MLIFCLKKKIYKEKASIFTIKKFYAYNYFMLSNSFCILNNNNNKKCMQNTNCLFLFHLLHYQT